MFAGRSQDGTAKFCSMRTWHSRPRPVWPTASGSWPGASPATTASTEAKSAFSEEVPEKFYKAACQKSPYRVITQKIRNKILSYHPVHKFSEFEDGTYNTYQLPCGNNTDSRCPNTTVEAWHNFAWRPEECSWSSVGEPIYSGFGLDYNALHEKYSNWTGHQPRQWLSKAVFIPGSGSDLTYVPGWQFNRL